MQDIKIKNFYSGPPIVRHQWDSHYALLYFVQSGSLQRDDYSCFLLFQKQA